MKQPREGQTRRLPKSANTDPATTHVAIHKQAKIKYFCRFDPTDIHGQEGIPDSEVKGTYWIVPCELYGSCYNGCSLWQGGFDFVAIQDWSE
jgi:hypothetical protein